MLRRTFVGLAATLLLPGCARSSGQPGPTPSFSNVITREELQQLDVRNLYDAIQQLRPRWLKVLSGPRSFSLETGIVVFQEEALLGDTEVLRRMGPEGVYSIRYLDGTTAKATLSGLGGQHVEGAIIVSLRPPRPNH